MLETILTFTFAKQLKHVPEIVEVLQHPCRFLLQFAIITNNKFHEHLYWV